MAHCLPTDSYSGSGAETIQCTQIGISSGEKYVVVLGFGSAVEIEFVEFVIRPGFIEDCCLNEATRRKPEGQTVRASRSIDIVRGLSPAAAGHIFRHDVRLSGNMLLQIGQYGP